jgi:hypothetical protein
MYPFMASFCNKITNYVSQGLESGAYVMFDILVLSLLPFSSGIILLLCCHFFPDSAAFFFLSDILPLTTKNIVFS